jgi:hypothetical protein
VNALDKRVDRRRGDSRRRRDRGIVAAADEHLRSAAARFPARGILARGLLDDLDEAGDQVEFAYLFTGHAAGRILTTCACSPRSAPSALRISP